MHSCVPSTYIGATHELARTHTPPVTLIHALRVRSTNDVNEIDSVDIQHDNVNCEDSDGDDDKSTGSKASMVAQHNHVANSGATVCSECDGEGRGTQVYSLRIHIEHIIYLGVWYKCTV